MKRDMDLIRLILLKIEEEYGSHTLLDLSIDGYDMETVAYHCKLLFEAGFVSYYDSIYSSGGLDGFQVGSITWNGHDYLDKVRDNSVWHKTKEIIKKNGLPLVIDTVKTISNGIITAATEGVVKAIMEKGGI